MDAVSASLVNLNPSQTLRNYGRCLRVIQPGMDAVSASLIHPFSFVNFVAFFNNCIRALYGQYRFTVFILSALIRENLRLKFPLCSLFFCLVAFCEARPILDYEQGFDCTF